MSCNQFWFIRSSAASVCWRDNPSLHLSLSHTRIFFFSLFLFGTIVEEQAKRGSNIIRPESIYTVLISKSAKV